MQLEEFERTLLEEIDQLEDCLRLYRFTEPSSQFVTEYGRFKAIDFDGPLVV
jgi:CRISPR-associated protein Cas2